MIVAGTFGLLICPLTCAYGSIRLIRLLLFRCIREGSALLYFIFAEKLRDITPILILGNTYCYFDTVKTWAR